MQFVWEQRMPWAMCRYQISTSCQPRICNTNRTGHCCRIGRPKWIQCAVTAQKKLVGRHCVFPRQPTSPTPPQPGLIGEPTNRDGPLFPSWPPPWYCPSSPLSEGAFFKCMLYTNKCTIHNSKYASPYIVIIIICFDRYCDHHHGRRWTNIADWALMNFKRSISIH
jgi:hypothetical protein